VLNAADEVAVAAFLGGRIAYPQIAETIDDAIARWGADGDPRLDDVVRLDATVRAELGAELGVVTPV
jgi:1-deoxy-D-xylulose-5-phosphate reductoisomerase